jgi:hypothetical protein
MPGRDLAAPTVSLPVLGSGTEFNPRHPRPCLSATGIFRPAAGEQPGSVGAEGLAHVVVADSQLRPAGGHTRARGTRASRPGGSSRRIRLVRDRSSRPRHGGGARAPAPPGVHHDDETAELKRRFGTWHDPIPGLMGTVAPGDVLHDDVYWIAEPLPAYHRGRVAILGDAAHAIRDDIPDRHRAAEHRDLAWLGASHPR